MLFLRFLWSLWRAFIRSIDEFVLIQTTSAEYSSAKSEQQTNCDKYNGDNRLDGRFPWVTLRAHQMLVYSITGNTRAIFMELQDGGKELVFLAYFLKEPSDYERELISDAAWETKSEFDGIERYSSECIGTNMPFEDLRKLEKWLFVRAEETGYREDSSQEVGL